MRDLNECKAEIFRLSDKKIKRRKKNRNRLLVVCLPLAVCTIAVCITLPNLNIFMHKGSSMPEENRAPSDSQTLESYEYLVEIDGSQNETTIFADTDKTQELSEYIVSLFAQEPVQDTNTNAEESVDQATGNRGENHKGPDTSYTIKITLASGEQSVYTLKGNILYSKKDNISTVLTDDEVTKLKSLINS